MLLRASPRFRLAATSATLLALIALGVAITLLDAHMLGLAHWHVELRAHTTTRLRCQYSFELTADDTPDWLKHSIHWSTQNRVTRDNQTRMMTTLYISGRGQSLFVMGMLSTYHMVALC